MAVPGPRAGVELVSSLRLDLLHHWQVPAQLLGCKGQFFISRGTEHGRGHLSWPAREYLSLWAPKGLWSGRCPSHGADHEPMVHGEARFERQALPFPKVKVWFQNRRIKWRKQSLEQQQAKLAKMGLATPQRSPDSQSHHGEEDKDFPAESEDGQEDTASSPGSGTAPAQTVAKSC